MNFFVMRSNLALFGFLVEPSFGLFVASFAMLFVHLSSLRFSLYLTSSFALGLLWFSHHLFYVPFVAHFLVFVIAFIEFLIALLFMMHFIALFVPSFAIL